MRSSFIPLYKQIAEKIRLEINGDYSVGEKLPSEVQLREKYQCSRDTIRKALKLLEKEELIIIKHGKGVFVSSHEIQMNTSSVVGYKGVYQLLKDQGLNIDIQLLNAEKVNPPKYIADKLECSVTDEVHLLHRRYVIKELPVAVFYTYFSPDIKLTDSQLERMKANPIRPILQEEIQSLHALEYTIEFKKPPREVVETLGTEPDSNIVVSNHISYKNTESSLVPFEMTKMYLVPEIAKFKFIMKI